MNPAAPVTSQVFDPAKISFSLICMDSVKIFSLLFLSCNGISRLVAAAL